jgi:glutamine amidotransferase
MARLFGLIGNRTDLAGRVLASEAKLLTVRAKGSPLGWGVGFYQGGEVLLRRRPIDEHEAIDVARVAGDLRADLLLGHVRSATVGALRTENTHPFRYRQWLFAQTGTAPEFEAVRERLVATVPEFLRSGIRGDTDSEVLFHVFLSFLHDRGSLNDPTVEPQVVAEALRSSLAVIDGMCAEVGAQPGATNLLVTNGEFLCAAHRGAAMGYRVYHGKQDAEALLEGDPQLRRRTPELPSVYMTLLASDFDDDEKVFASGSRWKRIQERAIVTLARGKDPAIQDL